jgi:hypothetical protein
MRSRSHLAFPLTILVTAAIALLPAGWRLGWSRVLAEVIEIPMEPFTLAGNALGGVLRSAGSPADGVDADEVEQLIEDRDRAQRLYHSERQRALALEERLREVQALPPTASRATAFAYVTARNPGSPLGIVKLRLEPGVSETIRGRKTVAVYASVNLLGRVVGEPDGTSCRLLPVVSRESGYLQARVLPRDVPLRPIEKGVLVQLAPSGTGVFTAEVDREVVLGRGDLVRLSDDRWPESAQAMVVGEIDSIEVNDREPLRNTITVRPRYQVQDVAYVALLIETEDDGSGGTETTP